MLEHWCGRTVAPIVRIASRMIQDASLEWRHMAHRGLVESLSLFGGLFVVTLFSTWAGYTVTLRHILDRSQGLLLIACKIDSAYKMQTQGRRHAS